MVVHRTCGSLKGSVGAQVKVVLERMSDILLHQSPRHRIAISISPKSIVRLGEEANMVPLRGDNDNELGLFVTSSANIPPPLVIWLKSHIPPNENGLECITHISNFLLQHVLVLAFGNSITEVVDVRGRETAIDRCHPMPDKWQQKHPDVGRRNHLDATPISLASCGISNAIFCQASQKNPHHSRRHLQGLILSRGTVMAAIDGCSVIPGG